MERRGIAGADKIYLGFGAAFEGYALFQWLHNDAVETYLFLAGLVLLGFGIQGVRRLARAEQLAWEESQKAPKRRRDKK